MVRIRYIVNEESNELVSKPIQSADGLLRSRITRSDEGWRIVVEKMVSSDGWQETTVARFTRNLAVAKAKAKTAMKELGVFFLEEIRRRGEPNV